MMCVGGFGGVVCAVGQGEMALAACALHDPLISDSGASHLLLRRSILPHLHHLFVPATLPPLCFSLPNGDQLWAREGGELRFPLHHTPIPVYVCDDGELHHNLVGVAPLVRGGGCAVYTSTCVSFYSTADTSLPPYLSGSKKPEENL